METLEKLFLLLFLIALIALLLGCAGARDVGLHPENIGNPIVTLASQGGIGLTISHCLLIIFLYLIIRKVVR